MYVAIRQLHQLLVIWVRLNHVKIVWKREDITKAQDNLLFYFLLKADITSILNPRGHAQMTERIKD